MHSYGACTNMVLCTRSLTLKNCWLQVIENCLEMWKSTNIVLIIYSLHARTTLLHFDPRVMSFCCLFVIMSCIGVPLLFAVFLLLYCCIVFGRFLCFFVSNITRQETRAKSTQNRAMRNLSVSAVNTALWNSPPLVTLSYYLLLARGRYDVIALKPLRWKFPNPVDSKHAVIVLRWGVMNRSLMAISHLKHAMEHYRICNRYLQYRCNCFYCGPDT